MNQTQRYRTFTRSARNFSEFSSSRKRTRDTGLTFDEARRSCEQFNATRTASQIRRGTKLEFESQ